MTKRMRNLIPVLFFVLIFCVSLTFRRSLLLILPKNDCLINNSRYENIQPGLFSYSVDKDILLSVDQRVAANSFDILKIEVAYKHSLLYRYYLLRGDKCLSLNI